MHLRVHLIRKPDYLAVVIIIQSVSTETIISRRGVWQSSLTTSHYVTLEVIPHAAVRTKAPK